MSVVLRIQSNRMAAEKTITTSWRPSPDGEAERVIVIYSPNPLARGRAAILSDTPLRIGRGEEEAEAGLTLDDDKVSRQHAVIERRDGGACAVDLGSRNGTFVNAVRVTEAHLTDGDVIRVGAHLLLYQSLDQEACLRMFDRPPPGTAIIGSGHRLQAVHSAIQSVARETYPVLIVGESGVGKELVAEAIHTESGRAGSFIPINCAALPENLVESELFGHARGAFTGAGQRRGLFKEAEHGTLFLDEIGDMRLDLQAKLLRVLVTGEVRPVGEDRAHQVDVRIVAATNADLEKAVEEGRFRGDLYARLMGYVIKVPPLKARREDILEIASHFLSTAGFRAEFTPDAAEALLVYDWPYHVRELEQVMRIVGPAAARSFAVDLNHLPERFQKPFTSRHVGAARPLSVSAPSPLLTIRRDAPPTATELKEVLTLCNGNISKVAAFFRKDRRQIYRWAERLGVDVTEYRDEGEKPEGGTSA